ncbi:MAG: BamA/TamA family outer membrane protein, partial [Bacteroidales bacterium]|nr:BamA/TamA family outer membrane protein [Bacteroidales bacterium]
MKATSYIYLTIVLLAAAGCSNTRFLAEDDLLYTGKGKVEIINRNEIPKTASVKKYVESITTHKVNNAIFDTRVLPPVGLWVHNYMKVEGKGKFTKWLYKTLSSSPVLVSDVNPELRSAKIENDLFDRGYFHTRAWAVVDTGRKNPKKAKISYFIDLAPPNYYGKVAVDTLADRIDSLMSTDEFMNQIKPGDQFSFERLQKARNDLSKRIQENGYYYFVPEFIELKADTTDDADRLDLTIGKNNDLPRPVLSAYRINDITLKYMQGRSADSMLTDTAFYDGIKIISPPNILKPDILLKSIYFKKGDTYSTSASQSTITRLNNLGVFKSVNISYLQNLSDSLASLLDVEMDLLMSDNINLDLEGDLTTKSSGYFGPLLSATVSHGNTFKGAERLKLGLTGGFEWQWGSKSNNQIGNISYQLGISSGLTLPRILIPFKKENPNSMLFQRTIVNLDFSVLNRTAYYKMLSAKTNLNYQWSRNRNIQHSLYPVYINSVNLLETTPEFDSVVNENIYIRKSFEEQFIIGPKYEFSFNNTLTLKPSNFVFQGGISTSANIIDLIAGINKNPDERPYYFLDNIYSQYVKVTSDFRYYRNFFDKSLVFRLYAGIGVPYGNSLSLPYVEQFFSGGAYSIRAFTARYLGPGSFHTDDQSGYIDQSGDIKLEGNMEFRFDMSGMMKGAVFLEAGNIWLVNEDENRPGAKFDINTFHKELAVGTGFGVRFDFTFFVLRIDLGLPLRTPYVTDGTNWLFGSDQIFAKGIFNI